MSTVDGQMGANEGAGRRTLEGRSRVGDGQERYVNGNYTRSPANSGDLKGILALGTRSRWNNPANANPNS